MGEEKKIAKLFGKAKKKLIEDDHVSDSERLHQGQIVCRVILEVLGKPKEHVIESLKGFVENIKENKKKYHVIRVENSEPEEVEGMFSTYAEIELWAIKPSNILDLCYDYMPSSIEILEPNNVTFTGTDLTAFINDMQTRIHNIDMLVKNVRAENRLLKLNFANLLKNSIVLALTKKDLSIEEIAEVVGIRGEHFKDLFEEVTKSEPRIIKKGEKYSLRN